MMLYNIIKIIFIILFLYYISNLLFNKLFNKSTEKFDILSNVIFTNYEAPYKSDICEKPKEKVKCCLIEKKFLKSENTQHGDFKYTYNKLNDEKCDINLYNLDNNKQLFIEGDNNWSNTNCKDNNIIGSCRNINKECIDFVTKEYCDHYKLVWNKNTCQYSIPYVWVDRENRVVEEKRIDDKFQLFN